MTWWDCVKNNMESLGLSPKDDCIYGDVSPGKMAVKTECVCFDGTAVARGSWTSSRDSPYFNFPNLARARFGRIY